MRKGRTSEVILTPTVPKGYLSLSLRSLEESWRVEAGTTCAGKGSLSRGGGVVVVERDGTERLHICEAKVPPRRAPRSESARAATVGDGTERGAGAVQLCHSRAATALHLPLPIVSSPRRHAPTAA